MCLSLRSSFIKELQFDSIPERMFCKTEKTHGKPREQVTEVSDI